MRQNRWKRGFNSKGFTMVELIVVMVIMVIMLSVSATGILRYQRYADFKRNDDQARNIFSAAQSALTHYKYTGKLEEFAKEVEQEMEESEYAGEVADNLIDESKLDGERSLYYLYIPRMDLEQDDLEKTNLYLLTKDYIYSREVYDASIRIEFDPVDGMVYSVCYSDRAERFNEEEADGDEEADKGTIGIGVENREETVRRTLILGYWSSELPARQPRKMIEAED